MSDDTLTGPLSVWMHRLQCKVELLENNVAVGNTDRLAKDLATCDTYLKKLLVRVKDQALQTAAGPQMVLDLSHIKVRLGKLRTKMRYLKLQTGEIMTESGLYTSLLH